MSFIYSKNPSTGKVIWKGEKANVSELDTIIEASKKAQRDWRDVDIEDRKLVLTKFAQVAQERMEELATAIASENGKPFWEAKAEVNSLISKTKAVIASYE